MVGKVWRREKEEWGAQKAGDWEFFGGAFLFEPLDEGWVSILASQPFI